MKKRRIKTISAISLPVMATVILIGVMLSGYVPVRASTDIISVDVGLDSHAAPIELQSPAYSEPSLEDKGDNDYELDISGNIVEIGDTKEVAFDQLVKYNRWGGESWFSKRLILTDKITTDSSLVGDKIVWGNSLMGIEIYALDNTKTDAEFGAVEYEIILKEKPASNILYFQLDYSPDVAFYYQKPFTSFLTVGQSIYGKEIGSVSDTEVKDIDGNTLLSRPENMSGGYVVQSTTKRNHIEGGINYATGMIGEIHRPKAVDSKGWEVWGDLLIENGIMSVTLPQDFIDKAVYPIYHAAGDTFGYTSLGSMTVMLADYGSFGGLYTATSGTVTSITAHIYVDDPFEEGGTQACKAVIYRDTFGLISRTEEETPIAGYDDWLTFTLDNGGYPAGTKRVPTGDGNINGIWNKSTGSTYYELINNSSDSTYMTGTTDGGGYEYSTFTAFDIPDGTITGLKITYRAKATTFGTSNMRAGIKVNDTLYGTTDSGISPSWFAWSTYSYTFTTNPDTSAAWEYDDINGTGSNPLQQFGVNSTDLNPDVMVSEVYAEAIYEVAASNTLENDDYYIMVWAYNEVTKDLAVKGVDLGVWNGWSDMNAGNYNGFKDPMEGTPNQIPVDFSPSIYATYTAGGGTPDISNTPDNYSYGVIEPDTTPATGLDYFAITNNSGGAVTITISAADFTGGVGWTLSDTATPDVDTVGLKAGLEGGDYTIIVKKTPAYNILVSGLANEATQKWGLKLYSATSHSDGVAKSTTVTLTAVLD